MTAALFIERRYRLYQRLWGSDNTSPYIHLRKLLREPGMSPGFRRGAEGRVPSLGWWQQGNTEDVNPPIEQTVCLHASASAPASRFLVKHKHRPAFIGLMEWLFCKCTTAYTFSHTKRVFYACYAGFAIHRELSQWDLFYYKHLKILKAIYIYMRRKTTGVLFVCFK